MECEQVRENLTLHLLGDLAGKQAEKIEVHLAACPDCQKEEAGLRRTLKALNAVEEVPASPARRSRLFKAAAAEGLLPARPLLVRLLLPLGALAGAAALLLAVSVLAGLWQGEETPVVPEGMRVVMGGRGGNRQGRRRPKNPWPRSPSSRSPAPMGKWS